MKNGAKVNAEILGYEENKVILKVRGKDYQVPFGDFSSKDQEYLKKYAPHLEEESAEPVEKGDESSGSKKSTSGAVADTADAEGIEPNWDAPWPGNVTTPDDLEIVEEASDAESGEFIYLSPHYRFVCDVRLSTSVVRSFARLFEATHASMEALPLNFERARHGNAKNRHKVFLFEKEETYFEKGGAPGSAGVYIGGRDGGDVLVPLTSLGVKPMGSGYTRDRKKSNKTLPHELAHQLTDHVYYAHGSRGWFTEGLAEYVASSQMTDSRFNFDSNLDEIEAYATAYGKDDDGGRSLGEEISLGDLRKFMLQPYSQFTGNANFNYGMGLLLTTYFLHLEDDGSRANVVAFMKAMRDGLTGEELLDVLRAGRSWKELGDDISAGWRRKGIKIKIGE
ncbi:hypothetical protein V2O64_23505 [Verrucomicrobiaceae bacterium 227]